ncbi:hypothetical protein QFC20_005603 [Naganishia adeliensis]|uniref:Uncharacterized protein n=1 Tax=Naganishia adeliensis TaxID=92952 RepID=A0ACC2VKW2_9TREE|nr:hypothetical protein QFC20_005603 [Naganishia adeliensis]
MSHQAEKALDIEHVELGRETSATTDIIKAGPGALPTLARLRQGKADAALEILHGERVEMTDEQSRLICRKIDRVILPILAWVYFLQILDKSVVGYGANFGMKTDANLVGNQYSLIGSSGYWAQLGWQPVSALLIIKVPTRILMTATVTLWGVATCAMAASTNFQGLIASRFFLGLFEASCLPLFSIITVTWYRRSEQPLRVGIWYCTNGIANMLGSLLAYVVSFIKSDVLYVYQILFLIVGLVTVLTGPLIYWRIDNNPAVARFLTPEERRWAVERLRDNNTGVESRFIQASVILVVCWLAVRYKHKSIFLGILLVPCIVGSGLLYGLGRGKKYTGPLLLGYYLIGFLYGANPLITSWREYFPAYHPFSELANTSTVVAMFALGNASGNIVGPLLFKSQDAPYYRSGLRAVLGIFVAAGGAVALIVGCYFIMNKQKEKERVANGKPAKLTDRSMDRTYAAGDATEVLGQNAFLDLTDKENDEVRCGEPRYIDKATANLFFSLDSLSTSTRSLDLQSGADDMVHG